MKRQDVIELLERLIDHNDEMAIMFEQDGDEITAKEYFAESHGMRQALFLLTDDKYAKDIKKIMYSEKANRLMSR